MKTTDIKNELSSSQFDRTKFHRHTTGCEQVRPEIIAAFITQTPSLLSELDNALNESKARTTSKIVHKLKSSVGLFCTDSLFAEISEVERGAVHIEAPEYLSAVRRLIMRIGKLITELQQMIANDYPLGAK
jgi:hypothetical protein